MKTVRWQLTISAALACLSLLLLAARWLFFPGDSLHNEMLRYLLDDVAFLFIQVLIVTVVIDRLMQSRERQAMLQKLNMVIGAFFSQLGTELLRELARADRDAHAASDMMLARSDSSARDVSAARAAAIEHAASADMTTCDLAKLRDLLVSNKPFLLGLLGNQALLEHEAFTDLLWAVTHLAEELDARVDLRGLAEPDRAHITGDIRRAYGLLMAEWFEYLRHLKAQYPYLYSLAVRMNPLNPSARAEIVSA